MLTTEKAQPPGAGLHRLGGEGGAQAVGDLRRHGGLRGVVAKQSLRGGELGGAVRGVLSLSLGAGLGQGPRLGLVVLETGVLFHDFRRF